MRAVLERSRLLTGALVGLAAYLGVVCAGVFGIAGLAETSAQTAMHVADAISSSIDEGADASDLPRVLRAASAEYAAPIAVDSESFDHARVAPPSFERLNADEIADIKNTVSERIVTDDAQPWHSSGKQTFKTMCVRLCDGAYFPISFATTREHFARDEAVCTSRCGSPARLFVFPNPGGSPDAMRDRAGHSYLALPTAYQFRKGAVSGCGCQAKPWELASRDRHRLYAIEQEAAAGRHVDMAEMSRLRASVTIAARERVPAVQSMSPIETATLAPPSTIDTSSKQLPQVRPTSAEPLPASAAPSHAGNGSGRPIETEIASRHPIAAAIDAGSAEAVRTEAPPLPEKSNLEVRATPERDGSASLEQRIRKTSSRRGTNPRSASRQAARLPPPPPASSRKIPDHEIWGVGRNARGGPRGGSALETFARNFY